MQISNRLPSKGVKVLIILAIAVRLSVSVVKSEFHIISFFASNVGLFFVVFRVGRSSLYPQAASGTLLPGHCRLEPAKLDVHFRVISNQLFEAYAIPVKALIRALELDGHDCAACPE